MGFPRVADFILMLQNKSARAGEAALTQAVISRELDLRFQPELCLTLGMVNVHVHPCFLTTVRPAAYQAQTAGVFSRVGYMRRLRLPCPTAAWIIDGISSMEYGGVRRWMTS
jgi:hypothetical protein